jgi:heat shock protein HslJ
MKTTAVILIFMAFISCQNQQLAHISPENTADIVGHWQFMGYAKADGITESQSKPIHPFDTFLEFDKNGKVSGRAAINLIYADYSIVNRIDDFRGNDLNISGGISTKIAVNQEQGDFEGKYDCHLDRITSYKIVNNNVLVLYEKYPNPVEALIFRKNTK